MVFAGQTTPITSQKKSCDPLHQKVPVQTGFSTLLKHYLLMLITNKNRILRKNRLML